MLTKDIGRAVVGLSRLGKGTWLKNVVIPRLRKAGRSIVVIDIDDEYTQEGRERDGTPLGDITHRVEAPDFEDWLVENKDEVFLRQGLELAIVPVSRMKDGAEVAEQVKAVLPWLADRGDVDVVLEEMGRWSEHATELTKAMAMGWLKEGVRPWFIAQNFRSIDIQTRSQVSEIYSFQQVDRADLRFLTDLCGRGFALEVAKLEPHNFRARNRREPDPALLAELAGMQPAQTKEK
ncbi:MAG TPA: hypothetical protein VFZ09_01235 [Archangium sp.]|uniref:hypothetical protein n=1 Tax=Archangium sp. TaxID=1872627 RepID=UPI002E3436C8|nr:hypothetical protein [Archangium sp.]HEX5744832.1 hypothetical protein [Archangium sp.]